MPRHADLHIVFGAGPLGKSVVRALLSRGRRVRLVNRSGKADVPPEVEIITGDAYDPAFTHAVTSGAEVVYQCAQPRYNQWVQHFPALQETILQSAALHGAKAVIGDNLYMYGPVDGPIHEDLPYNATTRKGRVRARMAQAALHMHALGDLQVAIGRGSDFYGPEVTGSVVGERAFGNIIQGKAAQGYGSIDLPHTYTYIRDFGEALAILGEREEAFGQAWHVPNAPTITTRQLYNLAFEIAGLPPKINLMSRFMLMLGGIFISDAREMVEMTYEFEKPFVVDSSKFVNAFGDCSTPVHAAVEKTVAWYQKNYKPA